MKALGIVLLLAVAFIGGYEYHRQQSPCTIKQAIGESLWPW